MQVVAGGGEDFIGVGWYGERKFDFADFQLAVAGVCHLGALSDEAGFVEFAGPRKFHALFHVFCDDGDGRRLLGFGGHVPIWIAILFSHVVRVAGCDGFGFDVGDDELAEQFHAVATHVEAGGADPGFGLRGQDAWPCGVVERAGDSLRGDCVKGVEHGFRSGKRTPPMHKPWQIVAGKHKRDGSAGGRLLGVDGGEVSAVG